MIENMRSGPDMEHRTKANRDHREVGRGANDDICPADPGFGTNTEELLAFLKAACRKKSLVAMG